MFIVAAFIAKSLNRQVKPWQLEQGDFDALIRYNVTTTNGQGFEAITLYASSIQAALFYGFETCRVWAFNRKRKL